MLKTLNDYCKAPHCSTSRNLCHVHLQQVVMKTLRSHDEVSAESDLGLGEAMREELRGGKHWLIVQLLFSEAKNRLEEAKIAFAGELVPSFGHIPGEIPLPIGLKKRQKSNFDHATPSKHVLVRCLGSHTG